eukprot:UC4_evm2s22
MGSLHNQHHTKIQYAHEASFLLFLNLTFGTSNPGTDMVRQQDVPPKDAIKMIKKRMLHKNPNVALKAATVLEMVVKNCGSPVHEEVASKDFMADMRKLVQVLELIQIYAHVFKDEPRYSALPDTYNILRMEGYTFPDFTPTDDAIELFKVERPPEWQDSDVCFLTRAKFTLTVRKHHCRNCGQVFCAAVCSQMIEIPKFGYEKPVRVCDPCFDKLKKEKSTGDVESTRAAALAAGISPGEADQESLTPEEEVARFLEKERKEKEASSSSIGKSAETEEEKKQQEQEELELAMAISLSEQEASKSKPRAQNATVPNSSPTPAPSSTAYDSSSLYGGVEEQMKESRSTSNDKYSDRKYWEEKEKKLKGTQARVPEPGVSAAASQQRQAAPQRDILRQPSLPDPSALPSPKGLVMNEQEAESLDTMKQMLQLLKDKIKSSMKLRGTVKGNSSIDSLVITLETLRPQLERISEKIDKESGKHHALVVKLFEVQKARKRISDLNKMHQEKLRMMAEEADMLQKLQLEQKLQLMRQQEQARQEHQKLIEQKQQEAWQQHRQIQERKREEERESERIQEQIALEQKVKFLNEQAESQRRMDIERQRLLGPLQPTQHIASEVTSHEVPSQNDGSMLGFAKPVPMQHNTATAPGHYFQQSFSPHPHPLAAPLCSFGLPKYIHQIEIPLPESDTLPAILLIFHFIFRLCAAVDSEVTCFFNDGKSVCSTPTSEKHGIAIVLQNVVSTVNLKSKLDLKNIALHARNAEYNPKRFAAVIMRIREPRTTALVFSSGKMVVTGAKGEDQSLRAARKFARIIQKLGNNVRFSGFKIQNMVASFDVKFAIRLEGLGYEPELFPGLIYRMAQPKVVLLIFVSGKVVMTGAKSTEQLKQAFDTIYLILQTYRKT